LVAAFRRGPHRKLIGAVTQEAGERWEGSSNTKKLLLPLEKEKAPNNVKKEGVGANCPDNRKVILPHLILSHRNLKKISLEEEREGRKLFGSHRGLGLQSDFGQPEEGMTKPLKSWGGGKMPASLKLSPRNPEWKGSPNFGKGIRYVSLSSEIYPRRERGSLLQNNWPINVQRRGILSTWSAHQRGIIEIGLAGLEAGCLKKHEKASLPGGGKGKHEKGIRGTWRNTGLLFGGEASQGLDHKHQKGGAN